MAARITRTDAQWRARLTPLQYIVTRKGGSERPFSGPFHAHRESGIYACVCCGTRLYHSAHKQESAAGYPAFSLPLPGAPLDLRPDHGWMLRRMRIACARCGALLGHLAGDEARPPLHQLNSAALRFLPD